MYSYSTCILAFTVSRLMTHNWAGPQPPTSSTRPVTQSIPAHCRRILSLRRLSVWLMSWQQLTAGHQHVASTLLGVERRVVMLLVAQRARRRYRRAAAPIGVELMMMRCSSVELVVRTSSGPVTPSIAVHRRTAVPCREPLHCRLPARPRLPASRC